MPRSPEPRYASASSSHRKYRDPSPTRYDRSHASSSARRPDEGRTDHRDRDYRYKDRDGRDDRLRDRDRDPRRDDRDRDRDRNRDRDRDRDHDRDYRRDDDRRRRDDRDGFRDRDRERERDRDRSRDRTRDRDDRRREGLTPTAPIKDGTASPSGSPAPKSEDEALRLKRERLEKWKRDRAVKEGKTASNTPEPPADKSSSSSTGKTGLPAKPTAFSLSGLSRIGLPVRPGSGLKRSFGGLDDEEQADRKLQKLDLPDFKPEVQSGEAANEGAIGDDLAAEELAEEDVKPDIKPESVEPEVKANGGANGHAAPVAVKDDHKMDVDEPEDEEDELDAYMKSVEGQVKDVNVADAKRHGLMGVDAESDEETEVTNKAEEELAKAEEILRLAASKQRKKDLPTPDHSKIDYEPFRKSFYSAPVEVLDMDEEETELLRLEMDGIKIRGQDAPKPVKNWGAFGLPTVALDIIRAKEWATPTAIQAQSIPAIMSGRDVIGIAKTGSGKTIAFMLPLLRHVKAQRPVGGAEGPIAVVMGPTRELAMQIYKEGKVFLGAMGIRVACCVGGTTISEDIAAMKKGAEVVVCTPGRLIDLLTANNGRVSNLRRTTYLVLDEADRMFDMGFEPQVMKIVNNIRPEAQKVLFSATFPKTMEGLARKILTRPLEITVGGRSVVAPEIDQRVEVRDHDTKFTRLLEILGEISENNKDDEDFRTLIFVDRQDAADDLFRELLQRGYVCASLHGGKEQVDRDEAIKNFKNGDVPIIVATSVAARGLDVKELKLVINYDCPNHLEDYVHRAGRTGRAGNTGTAITFVTPEQEKFSVDIVRALEASKAYVPPKLREMSDAFLAKIKSGKAKAAGSGFAGKGLERIERKRQEKDSAEKHTYGDTSEAVSLSSREGAVIPYKPKTNEFVPQQPSHKGEADYTFTEIKVDIINGPAPDIGKATTPGLYAATGRGVGIAKEKLEALQKNNVDVSALQKIVAKLNKSIELTKADRFALAQPAQGPRKTKDPDATDWHAIFPINDYPQKARWEVTQKIFMAQLGENIGASITMRGIFYPPGQEPGPGGEPKLHLLIESNEEAKVRLAVEEIRRKLIDGSMLALNNADRAGAGGRYAV